MITKITITLTQEIEHLEEADLLNYLDKIYKFKDLDFPKSIPEPISSIRIKQPFNVIVSPPNLIDLRKEK